MGSGRAQPCWLPVRKAADRKNEFEAWRDPTAGLKCAASHGRELFSRMMVVLETAAGESVRQKWGEIEERARTILE